MKPIFTLLCAVLVPALLSACTPLGVDQSPVQVYRLAPRLPVQSASRPLHVYVPEPEIAPPLASEQIVLFMPGNRQDFVAHSRWPDTLGTYLQAVLVEELSRSNAFASVSAQLIETRKAVRLQVRVADFQAEYPPDGKGVARVRVSMEVLLIRQSDQHLLARHRYEQQQAVELRTGQIVAGLDAALRVVLVGILADLAGGD